MSVSRSPPHSYNDADMVVPGVSSFKRVVTEHDFDEEDDSQEHHRRIVKKLISSQSPKSGLNYNRNI